MYIVITTITMQVLYRGVVVLWKCIDVYMDNTQAEPPPPPPSSTMLTTYTIIMQIIYTKLEIKPSAILITQVCVYCISLTNVAHLRIQTDMIVIILKITNYKLFSRTICSDLM